MNIHKLILLTLFITLVNVNGYGQLSIKQCDSALKSLSVQSIQHYDSAIILCDRMIEVYRRNGNRCSEIHTTFLKSMACANEGRLLAATENLQLADKMLQSSECKVRLLPVSCQANANISYFLQDVQKADSFARIGIKAWSKRIHPESELAALYLIAGFINSDLEQSLTNLQEAYKLAKANGYEDLELRALNNIGAVYGRHERYEDAEVFFKKALPLASKRKSYKELGWLFNNLAGLSDDASSQEGYLDSAIHFARLRNNLVDLALYTENKALFCREQGNYEQAYFSLWNAMNLKDSLLNIKKMVALVEMEQKYEAEKKSNEIQKLKVEQLAIEVNTLRSKRNLYIGISAALLMLGFMIYRYVTVRRNRNQLAEKNIEIDKARKVSDQLLLNILPEEVANELKAKGSSETREFNQVSVLFTDFVNFTEIGSKLSPAELVSELNYCFKAFDSIIEKYKIEKIKTIGDAYMAAGNLPLPIDQVARQTVLAAFDMQAFIIQRGKERQREGKPSFQMRLGINVGPVVAGIVGVKKFQYDIWGDTVNTAARMESNGAAGKVNISQSTYEMLLNDPEFIFQSRGMIDAKGKGQIAMYFVEKANRDAIIL